MVHQLNLKFNEELKPRKDTEYIILHHSGVESRHSFYLWEKTLAGLIAYRRMIGMNGWNLSFK